MEHSNTNILFVICLKLKLNLASGFCIVCSCSVWEPYTTSLGNTQSLSQNIQNLQARRVVTNSFNSVGTDCLMLKCSSKF